MSTSDNTGLSGTPRAGFFSRLRRYWIDPYRTVDVARYILNINGLRSDFKIVVVSDIHASTWFMPAERLREIIDQTNALSPDVIVLPGDFMAEDNRFQTPLGFDSLMVELSRLEASQGIYAVTGNHDWWDDPDTQPDGKGPCRTVHELAEIGIETLANRSVRLPFVNLCGVDSQHAMLRDDDEHVGRHDVDRALGDIDATKPTILLAHEPDIWPDLPNNVDLTISGHTHGGQVTIFGTRPVVPSKFGALYAYGHHRLGPKHLVVSGGLGCSKAPLRFGVVPEIVEITLKPIPATK